MELTDQEKATKDKSEEANITKEKKKREQENGLRGRIGNVMQHKGKIKAAKKKKKKKIYGHDGHRSTQTQRSKREKEEKKTNEKCRQ